MANAPWCSSPLGRIVRPLFLGAGLGRAVVLGIIGTGCVAASVALLVSLGVVANPTNSLVRAAATASTKQPTPTVAAAQPALDPAIYPEPTALVHDIGQLLACPSAAGLQAATLTAHDAVAWFRDYSSPDPRTRQKSADRAYWPLLPPPSSDQLAENRIAVGAAQASPYAALLTHACGPNVIALSQWLRVCPVSCTPAAGQSPIGHFFLINRQGHWLLWAIE